MAVFGMTRTVLRNLFTGPATRRYPWAARRGGQAQPHHAAQSRGHIENDIETCIFCSACVKRCPTDAIIVIKLEKEWNIDRLRCCTCNACVEVCPVKCLRMETSYTRPTLTRDKDIYRQAPRPATSVRE
jgi:ech hydrogenase subunit F